MSPNEARAAVYTTFKDAWILGTERLTPYFFDNMAYTTGGIDEFIELKMLHTPSEQATLGSSGNRLFRREGIIRVVIQVPTDKGLRRTDELGLEILRILEGETFVASSGSVRLTNGYLRELGPSGSRYKSEVIVNFYYHDQK